MENVTKIVDVKLTLDKVVDSEFEMNKVALQRFLVCVVHTQLGGKSGKLAGQNWILHKAKPEIFILEPKSLVLITAVLFCFKKNIFEK